MKILQLRFKNLNSLVGEWVIDFTAPDYVSDGIFAISGPTGSGKSTILDAICLALYGRTPRLKNISKTTNEIMSRQMGVCFTEVVFETNSGRFRTYWSQRRAREKADGLLQHPEHELSDAVSGKVLTSKITDTKNEVEKQTGMDYDRFVQSMMLAQGGFAAFLQASGNERAPILEQITGTEIYSHISKHVYDCHKNEKSALDILRAHMDGIALMQPEEEAQVREVLVEKKSSAVRWAAEKDKLEACIRWIRTINELHADLETIAKDELALASRLNAFLPKRESLLLANRASNIEGDYVMLTGLRKQQKDDMLALSSLHELVPELEAKIAAARDVFDESDKQHLALREENRVLLETTGKVRLMDQEINQKLVYIERVREQLTKLSNEKEVEANRKTKAAQAIDAFKTEQSVAAQYLKEHAHDAALSTELAGIRATSSGVIESYRQYQMAHNKLDTASKSLPSLAEGIRINETNLKQALIDNAADQENLTALSKDIDSLLQGRMPADLQKRKDALILHLADLRKIADFDIERTRLQDDKPCPLCGSLHHPFAEGNIPTSSEAEKELAGLVGLLDDLNGMYKQLELLKDRLRDSEKTVDRFRNLEANARQQWLQATQSVEQLTDEANTRKTGFETGSKALQDLMAPFQIDIVPLTEQDASALMRTLTDRSIRWQQNEKKRMEAAERITEEEAFLRMVDALMHAKTKDIEEKVTELKALEGSLHGLTTDRKEVFGDKVVKDEEERHATRVQDAALAKDHAAESLRMSRQALAENTSRISDLDTRIKNRTPELAAGESAFSRLLAETGFDDEAGFVSKRLPLAERQILEQEARLLDKMQTELQSRQHDRKARLAEEKAKNLTDMDMEALKIKHDEARIALNVLLEETGALKQRLEENELTRARGEEIRRKIEKQETVVSRWARLNNLIGSADGKKYRNFAQGLTFEIMVSYANIQLARLSDRYLLIRDREEPLELNVMDNYQAGEVRSTKNLSGGESFIVSLALALGLSRMSSRNVRVDSLFLDEGFGTLDEDTLETALGTLAGLRQDGKMIGVISHVGAMKERINTKILVQPLREGRSVLSGPGVRKSLGVEELRS